jgi:AICAR transformylase/IMP cyclohydrolase PurH
MSVYNKGDLLRVTGTFTNAAGTAVDPTAVILKHRNPAGTTTTLTYALTQLTKSATGIYYADVDLSSTGVWYFKFNSTGTGQAASIDSTVTVSETVF